MAGDKIVYIGMEETGFACLEKLLSMGCHILKVYTIDEHFKNDIVAFKSFRSLEKKFGIKIAKVRNINDKSISLEIRRLRPDLIYIVSWSQLVPKDILKIPSLGSVGFHASLLPRHRGRAPIPWSIIFGLRKSGVTMFYVTENPDAGDIIGQKEFNIDLEDNAYTVYKKVEQYAVDLLEKYHQLILEGKAPRLKQPNRDFDYWPRRLPSDGYIDWNKSVVHIYDWIRALTYPFPGAFTYYRERKLYIWKAEIFSYQGDFEPARIYLKKSRKGLVVGTAYGAINLKQAQFNNGGKLIGSDLLTQIDHKYPYFE